MVSPQGEVPLALGIAVMMAFAFLPVITEGHPVAEIHGGEFTVRQSLPGPRGIQGEAGGAPPSGRVAAVDPIAQKIAGMRATLDRLGAPVRGIHYPNLLAEGERRGDRVAPTYSGAPAPMGVADLGLKDVGGRMVGYYLNTSSVEGTIDFANAEAVYVDGDGPDMFGVQLNSVLTNVTLFGNSSYQFWTQNFVSYTPSSGELSFGDNIWNFTNSSGNISSNVFYAHGPNGTLYAPVLYLAFGPTFTIHYPFSLTFYLNSTLEGNRPAVFFNYTVANSVVRHSGSYDYVVFNSGASAPASPAVKGVFQVDGAAYNGIGLLNDIELSIVGNDNGDTTTFYQLNATASISTWNSTSRQYDAVPSAFNAGTDTGETSNGVASYYEGTAPIAQLALGPSFLEGLWNTTTPPGERTVVTELNPFPTLILVSPGTTHNEATAQWVPSSPTGFTRFSIPNTGTYFLEFELSEYAPVQKIVHGGNPNGSELLRVGLDSDPSLGIYTPMIAWDNSELAVFAASGAGTARDPYVLYDNERGDIDPVFDEWNDLLFPVFPGLLLISTSAHVDIRAPPFSISYPTYMLTAKPLGVDALGLPTTNNLQLEFWNVSNVTLIGAPRISGWLSSFLFSFYPLGAAIFWNSSGNLVARNVFADQGVSLALYGGSNNTIWGNSFIETRVNASEPSNVLQYPSNETGIWESDSGDLVYNNFLNVTVPAYAPRFDPLTCQVACEPSTYSEIWNVSRESASVSRTVLGTALNGSIIDSSYQGGNYWSNYGNLSNPYGVLPYNDSGWIGLGGDYVPLLPFSLYSVDFEESGLIAGAEWGVRTPLIVEDTTGSSLAIEGPNGTYSYVVVGPSTYQSVPPSEFVIHGQNVTVGLTFVPAPSSPVLEGSVGWPLIAGIAASAAILGGLLVTVWTRSRGPPRA